MNHNSSYIALKSYLEPLEVLFQKDNLTEIMINRPMEAYFEISGEHHFESIPAFTFKHLEGLAQLIAQSTTQKISP